MRIRQWLNCGACVTALLAVSLPAFAADDSNDIETVVVTATKRPTLEQDVPISMNIFNGAQLQENNIGDLKDLSTQIPGVTFFQTPTVPSFSMRGFASPSSNPAFDQTVAVYTDGIFAGHARQFQAPFFDMSQIEVVRGSQGALLGKNTSAGAITITTANPTDTYESAFSTTYLIDRAGTDSYGYISGPLSDDLSGRVAVKFVKTTQGWLKNAATGDSDPRDQTIEGRVSLDWHPSANADVITKIQYSDLEEDGRPSAAFPGTVPIDSVESFNRDVDSNNLVGGLKEGMNLKDFQGESTGTFKFGDLTLVSVSGYSAYTAGSVAGGGASDPEVFAIGLNENFSQASQELRLLSPTGQTFEWIVGAYFDYSMYRMTQIMQYDVFGGLIAGRGHSDFAQHGRTYSVFATGTWHITDDLSAIGSARWTRLGKSGHYQLFQDYGIPFGWVPGIDLDANFSEDHFDPSLTAQYDISKKIMAYASWSLGSKGGAFQGTNDVVTASTFALKPERSEDYEVGIKSNPTDWLTLNLDAYQLTFKNLQTGQYIGNPPTLVNVNAGKARSQGVEWVAGIHPTDDLSIDFTGSYIDALYLDYPGAPCTYAQTLAGCVNGSVNAAGEPLGGISKWSFSLSAQYDREIGDDLLLSFDPDVDFRTRYNIDAGVFNPYFGYQDGFAKVNFRLAVGADDGHWTVALVGRNIFDKLTLNGAYPWGPPFVASTNAVSTVDEGRSMGIQFSMKFN